MALPRISKMVRSEGGTAWLSLLLFIVILIVLRYSNQALHPDRTPIPEWKAMVTGISLVSVYVVSIFSGILGALRGPDANRGAD